MLEIHKNDKSAHVADINAFETFQNIVEISNSCTTNH